MNSNEQKLIIENLLSFPDTYARCSPIISGDYFDPEYRNAVAFVSDYYKTYTALPTFDILNAKFDLGLKSRTETMTKALVEYTCSTVEKFCKERAMFQAVHDSLDLIEEGNLGGMMECIKKAFNISLQRDIGIDMYDDPETRLNSLLNTEVNYSTCIDGLDKHLNGGLARKQLTLFSANSGVGKSIMLANLGVNYSALHKMNVLLISLELPDSMIFLRNSYIMSGVDAKEWKSKIPGIASSILNIKDAGAGSFIVKELPAGSTANDMRSLIKQYQLERGYNPDVVIVDYLDKMRPNGGVKNLQGYEQDQLKAQELYELIKEINAIGITASQQNRDALTNNAPTQGVVAGGLAKVNEVDNYISLYSDPAMKIRGELIAHFLKTRSADGVGKSSMLQFDTTCLRITDPDGDAKTVSAMLKKKRKKMDASKDAVLIDTDINLPGVDPQSITEIPDKVDKFLQTVENDSKVKTKVGKYTGRVIKDVTGITDDVPDVVKPQPKIVVPDAPSLPPPQHKKNEKEIASELDELDHELLINYFTSI
jgi:archaellum biogenesis ATPase FlaH